VKNKGITRKAEASKPKGWKNCHGLGGWEGTKKGVARKNSQKKKREEGPDEEKRAIRGRET